MGTLVVKVGSSTLVQGDGRLRGGLLRRLTDELSGLMRTAHRPVLVSSGAVAAGVGALGLPERPSELRALQAASAVGQALLFERYRSLLADRGLIPAQVLLTSADLERREPYLNARNLLTALLDMGVLPIVNENDATATAELTVGDNDRLAAHVAILLEADLLVLLTDREGILGGDPSDPRVIPEIASHSSVDALGLAPMTGSASGRGGVVAKIAAAQLAAESGVTAVVASGREPGVLADAVAGRPLGTRFPAARRGVPAETARPESDRLGVAWLTDLLVPRDIVERALGRERVERRYLGAGEVVFEQGGPGDALFMILGGEVEVERDDQVVAVLGPGSYFGEMALLGERVRTATVRCRRATSLLVLSDVAFRALVATVPELGARLRETAGGRRGPTGVAA